MASLVIDFDKLADIGVKGVRLVAVFMGLGLNAAHDPAFKKYELSSIQNIEPSMIAAANLFRQRKRGNLEPFQT